MESQEALVNVVYSCLVEDAHELLFRDTLLSAGLGLRLTFLGRLHALGVLEQRSVLDA